MRIGFVAHAVHRRGGMERAAAEVLERIACDHEVTIAAERCELSGTNVRWIPIRCPRKPALLNSSVFRFRTARNAALAKCDVVGTIGAAAIDADVITAQFCHAAFTARFGGLRGGRGIRAMWQRFAQSAFTKHERHAYTSPRLRRVIAVSRGTARELTEHYGVDPEIIRVIPNAVDHQVFKPANPEQKQDLRKSLGIDSAGLLAIFVGGDWGRKGLADAIRAIGKVRDVRLAVVGRGDIAHYRAIARDVGAESRVKFVGATDRPQDWMAASDFFLFPSLYEAFSLVTIEAAACGLPLLVTKINGSEELVEQGVNGLFVESDADNIAGAITQLRDDESLRTRLGKAAHGSSLSYTWDAIADAQRKVYEEANALIERRQSGSEKNARPAQRDGLISPSRSI